MENLEQLERRLWSAADQLRSNSKLTSTEYYMPILGLIFLRHAYNRFLVVKKEVEASLPSRGGVTRPLTKEDFKRKGALYLQEQAQYEYLLTLPSDQDVAGAIIKAMELIEADYAPLQGVLPKDYQIFESDVLKNLLKTFNDRALQSASGDMFGRIYEYFLMKFAMQGAQDNGEFFTPPSLVQTLVNVIEPDHGIVTDPACGSGGMFVQTSHFLEKVGKPTHEAVTFYGQEKTAATIKLAKMNLAVHGLEGSIAEGNSFYEDQHNLLGRADFVMANPPFNVDEVDAEKIKNDPRLPFGLPGVNKNKKVSNGNYLWISYFHSYLNATGRAGFVMSSQASSAGNAEKEVRRKLVESGDVDAMVSIRSNFFYTRTVPCELWFLDKGKPAAMRDHVLMLDARNIYRKVTRKVYDFSPEQSQNLTAIVWLYRGQQDRYLKLVNDYLNQVCAEAALVPEQLLAFDQNLNKLEKALMKFKEAVPASEAGIAELEANLEEWLLTFGNYSHDREALLQGLASYRETWCPNVLQSNEWQLQAREAFEPLATKAKGLSKQLDLLYKIASRTLEGAQALAKSSGLPLSITEDGPVGQQRKNLEAQRQLTIEQLMEMAYFHKQAAWLQTRFPEAKLRNVEGLVKLTSRDEIETNDWSLTPGRYVGASPQEVDEDFDFEETLRDIHIELAGLNEEAAELAQKIQLNFDELVL
ncbi:N-6 DNA methylase [Rufibacter glacialis]|uniref:site-specific DNA-methyltransferase (adenine-specific) n=1 Tax=Rufibacter glacialis TaxID=1259555 RepID=A0A5M8QHJ9_9BACT|nr:type I restriction-modification system subunit M [Rufibacter glacialis]KAA6434708.1 N-6 DNA methylase [Rufibacter glacialis]GGK71787.1 restriction endonuclease subunit M [Rufibacter glacialis]